MLLLPFEFSFICDEKIRYKVETRSTSVGSVERIIHRHKQGARFALMNSAPAELLQLLTIAALQPSSSHFCDDKIGTIWNLFSSVDCLNPKRKSRHA
ncbi:MAG: hypothetical protein ACJ8HI_17725 [Massilia sp.]